MEVPQILTTIWSYKRLLTVIALLALLAAVWTSYRISPSGLEPKSQPSGAATAQILVDSPQSALGNLKQSTVPLSTRAGVYAQFMASSAVRDEIAAVTGIPAAQIVAQGPFDDPAAAPTGAAAPSPPDTASLAAGKPYRLTLVSQQDLPLVTVYAEAPTAKDAGRLADGVAEGVRRYVDRVQTEGDVDLEQRVVIRSLGPAEAGTVSAMPNLPLMVLAFIAVMTIGSTFILALASLRRRRWIRAQMESESFDDWPMLQDQEADDGPAGESRPLRARPLEEDDRFHGDPVG